MTIIKHSRQRVGVLIDAQNLYHSAQNLYGQRVNFTEVLEEAVAGRQLVRAIAYVITSESGEEESFFEALESAGIETKAKDLQIFAGGAKKADWDVGIAVDAMKLAPKLDALVIASGDGDFIPAIEYVQHATGCQVEIISFGRSTSSDLIDVVDEFVDMDADTDKYLLRSRAAHRHNRRKHANRRNGSDATPSNNNAQTPSARKIEDQIKTNEEKVDLLSTENKKPDTSKPRVAVKAENKKPAKKITKSTTDNATKKAPTKKPARKQETKVADKPAKKTRRAPQKQSGSTTPTKTPKKAPTKTQKKSTQKPEKNA